MPAAPPGLGPAPQLAGPAAAAPQPALRLTFPGGRMPAVWPTERP